MRRFIYILIALVLTFPLLLRLALTTCLFAVDRTEYAYVTQLGRHIATYDGARDEDAGLHGRWPWPVQSVQTLDRRLQFFDLPETELLTHDPRGKTIDRTLTIVAYLCWRITDENEGVDKFVRRVGDADKAKAILGQRINSQLGAAVGRMELDDLISVVPGKVAATMDDLRSRLLEDLRGRVREDYGIDLVDMRLRRFNYPSAVRSAIFARIKSERDKKVADYQSEGAQLAANIRSEADRDARNIVTEARAWEQKRKGQADADADRIRSAAHSKDVEFYAFLKKLDEYQRFLGDNKTVLLLSANREWFDLLFHPPRPSTGNGNGTGKPITGPVPPKTPGTGGGR
jgi:membrane protease subunit HflC